MTLPANMKGDFTSTSYSTNIRVVIRTDTSSTSHGDTYTGGDIFLSQQATTVDYYKYEPLIISNPKFRESIDIVDKKFKTSSVNISISNIEYNGKIFSNHTHKKNIMYKEVNVWLDSQSTDKNYTSTGAESSILLFRGYITRVNHDKSKFDIQIEDLSEKKLSQKVPRYKVSTNASEDYINKPIPIVYGVVYDAPTVIENGIIKADSEPIKIITHPSYEGVGVSGGSNYRDYGIFSEIGDGSMRMRPPLSIYVNDVNMGIMHNKISLNSSPDYEPESQWEIDDIGQLSFSSSVQVEEDVIPEDFAFLQVQVITKPTSITGKNRSTGGANGSSYWWDYLNDWTGVNQGWDGVDLFTNQFKGSLVDSDLSYDLFKTMADYGVHLGNDFEWDFTNMHIQNQSLLDRYVGVNVIRIQYTYSDDIDVQNHSAFHYLAIGDKVIPRLYQTKDNTANNMSNLFVMAHMPDDATVWGTDYTLLKENKAIIDLDTELTNNDALSNANGDVFQYKFKNMFWVDYGGNEDEWYTGNTPYYDSEGIVIHPGDVTMWRSQSSGSNTIASPYILFSGDQFGVGNIAFGYFGWQDNYGGASLGADPYQFHMHLYGRIPELTTYYVAEIDSAVNKKFYLSVEGRQDETGSTGTLQNILDVIKDIAIREMGLYSSQIDHTSFQAAKNHNDIDIGFSLNKEISLKKLIEDISKNSLCFPHFKKDGKLSFPYIKEIYNTTDYNFSETIDNKDILSYSFKLSNVEDVYSRVNIEYSYNYHTKDFLSRIQSEYEVYGDGLSDIEDDYGSFVTADAVMLPYQLGFYQYDNVDENVLNFETKYITKEEHAKKIQKRLFQYHRNQHLELTLTLPLKYVGLEVGDIIKFIELIDNVRAFGQDYTKVSNPQWFHNSDIPGVQYGQFYYPLFIIESITKDAHKITIKAVRLHLLGSGYQSSLTYWQNETNSLGNSIFDSSQIYNYADYGPETSVNWQDIPPELCQDPHANNYGEEGPCEYDTGGGDGDGDGNDDDDGGGITGPTTYCYFPQDETVQEGLTQEQCESEGGEWFQLWEDFQVEGCMDQAASNYNQWATAPCLDCCQYIQDDYDDFVPAINNYPPFEFAWYIPLVERYYWVQAGATNPDDPDITGGGSEPGSDAPWPTVHYEYEYYEGNRENNNGTRMQYDINGMPVRGAEAEGNYTAKFIPVKDLVIHCPIEHLYPIHTSPAIHEYESIWEGQNSFSHGYRHEHDESVIGFYWDFVHPYNNLKIGQRVDWMMHYDEDGNLLPQSVSTAAIDPNTFLEGGEWQGGGQFTGFLGWDEEWEGWPHMNYGVMFNVAFGSEEYPHDMWAMNIMFNWFGWTSWDPYDFNEHFSDGVNFWSKFVGMEIQIQDNRWIDFQNVTEGGQSWGEYLFDIGVPTQYAQQISLDDIMPEMLPEWLVKEFQGKFTMALIAMNGTDSTIGYGAQVHLGWRIYPGHYNNFEYMYDVNDTFYDNLGRWVYENNQYEDTTLPWGYTFPGDDTWRAFFGAIAQVGNHFYASQIPYEVGGHGAEDVWIRVNTGPTEWVNNGGITAYNGLHDFIKTMQLPPIDMNWAWIYSSWAGGGTTSPMTPQSFGIYCNYGATSFGKEPFIVYRGDSWTYDFLGALGDFNLDNHLNISDVVATCNFILGTGQAPPDGANVDMDGDGTIYADDLIAMVNLILGLNQ